MRKRFIAAWRAIGARGNPGPKFDQLDAHYREPHRHYHNWDHISHCLDESDAARHLFARPDLVRLSLFYHDAIYDAGPSAKDNEEKSAVWAYNVCLKAGLSFEDCDVVKGLVRVTKHDTVSEDLDSRHIIDIDLAIFGQPAAVFDRYEKGIRAEYIWVPREYYSTARRDILGSFLKRDPIYFTDFFREKYEGTARENLERSIERLGRGIILE